MNDRRPDAGEGENAPDETPAWLSSGDLASSPRPWERDDLIGLVEQVASGQRQPTVAKPVDTPMYQQLRSEAGDELGTWQGERPAARSEQTPPEPRSETPEPTEPTADRPNSPAPSSEDRPAPSPAPIPSAPSSLPASVPPHAEAPSDEIAEERAGVLPETPDPVGLPDAGAGALDRDVSDAAQAASNAPSGTGDAAPTPPVGSSWDDGSWELDDDLDEEIADVAPRQGSDDDVVSDDVRDEPAPSAPTGTAGEVAGHATSAPDPQAAGSSDAASERGADERGDTPGEAAPAPPADDLRPSTPVRSEAVEAPSVGEVVTDEPAAAAAAGVTDGEPEVPARPDREHDVRSDVEPPSEPERAHTASDAPRPTHEDRVSEPTTREGSTGLAPSVTPAEAPVGERLEDTSGAAEEDDLTPAPAAAPVPAPAASASAPARPDLPVDDLDDLDDEDLGEDDDLLDGSPVPPGMVAAGAAAATETLAEMQRSERHATVICVANQKGGVGKTTTTVSLGAALAMEGAQVLVVDLDPQGNATTGLGLRAQEGAPSTYRVIVEQMDVEDASEPTAVKGLHVLPSSLDLAGAEIELVPAFSREMRLKNALDAVRDLYDVILIDCPPSLGLLTINAFVAADQVLVPIQCEYYALEGLGQLMRTVKLVSDSLNKQLAVGGVVLTMFDGRTNLAQQVVDEVRGYFGDVAYQTIVPRTVRLSEAPSYGQPIAVFDPSSRGARAYQRLAREVARRLGLELESEEVSPLDRLLGSLGSSGPSGGGMNVEDEGTLPTDLEVDDLIDVDLDADPGATPEAGRADVGGATAGTTDRAPAWSETAGGATAGTEDDR